MMTLSRSLSNYNAEYEDMQAQIQDKIEIYLQKKFRISHSFTTKNVYRAALKKFTEFIKAKYNLTLEQKLEKIVSKQIDPLDVLDEYYTFLATYQTRTKRNGYSSETVNQYVRVAKDFLNHQGCKIYLEDIKQKFRLPKRVSAYQKGLTLEAINRVIRFANPKLATPPCSVCVHMELGKLVACGIIKVPSIEYLHLNQLKITYS